MPVGAAAEDARTATRAPRAGGRHVAALLAAVALFLAPAWLGGGLFLARDDGRMHAPVKRFLARELAAGRLPEWNPYQGLGAPTLPSPVDAVQHPFTLLLLVFPAERALTVWVLLSVAGAALGAFWWARVLGASPHAAVAAGLAYALAGPVVSATDNVQYLTAVAALPALLAAGHRWVVAGGAARLGRLGVLALVQVAAGDPQSFGFALVALPVLAVALAEGLPRPRRLARGFVATGACAIAAAPVLLPLALWLPHSSRAGAIDAFAGQRWNLAPLRLWELAFPHLLRAPLGAKVWPLHIALADPTSLAPWALSVYLGASTVCLVAVGALRRRAPALLVLGAAVACWMALGPHAGFGQLAAHVPLVQGLRYWEKMTPWVALLLATAAALALDGIDADRAAKRRLAAVSAALAAVALLGALLAGPLGRGAGPVLADDLAANLTDGFLHVAAVSALLALVTIAALRRGRRPAVAIVAVVAIDLAAANAGAYELQRPDVIPTPTPLERYLLARPGIERVLTPFEPFVDRPGFTPNEATNLLGARTLVAAWSVRAGVGNFETYSGAVPARADEIERRLGRGRWPLVGLWGVGHVVVPGALGQLQALGLDDPPVVEAEDPATPAWLVAIPHRPRVYLAAAVRRVSEPEALGFATDPASTTSDVTVVEGLAEALSAPGAGEATVERETAGGVFVRVRASAPALLVLNDTWTPGWTALLDGVEVPVLRANYLVRAVVVPAGEHAVHFRYRTPGLAAGWLVALGGVLALLVLTWRQRAERRRGAQTA